MTKKTKYFFTVFLSVVIIFLLTGCTGDGKNDAFYNYPVQGETEVVPEKDYIHDSVVEKGFVSVSEEPSSYFSLDRNTSSYGYMRRIINNGDKVEADSVRIEEFINYFDYSFPAPESGAVAVSGYLSECPWNAENKLMMVGLKTAEYEIQSENANYVFLIDVSGSMAGVDRIDLAKSGITMLTDSMGEKDVVSLVTYASGVNTVLDGVECTEDGRNKIKKSVARLTASGSTSGEGGLETAYDIAGKHYIENGNNRVIIISDGDFNVGINNTDDLKEFIQDKAKSKIYLSVLGVGMGNTRDDMLQTLALSGNGNYAYLDSETEAKKVFCDELNGTLKTVAKDAKAGVTFTSAVEKYRLIGYDTKLISEDDFNNTEADTGEIGSNLRVVALYEIKLSDSEEKKLADIEIKYKDVLTSGEEDKSVKSEITKETQSCDDLEFISCVAEFGLILRDSDYKGSASLSEIMKRLQSLTEYIGGDLYKNEFVTIVGKASEIYG